MPYALGIDLGTTFSAAAVNEHGRTEIVSLGNRAAAVPTVVLVRADGEVLIGEAAERRAISEPLRTAREFKRRLGDPTPVLLGGTPYGAEALYARMLRGIVAQVVELHGERPAAIVVTHPANYGPYKLDLLQQAVRMAEIGPVTFITEPLAAALHYGGRERIEPGQVVAVYDFGGGTFDAALLRRTQDGFEPIGQPEGIERLGGIDFDEAVFAHIVNSLRSTFDRLDPHDPDTRAAIARVREEARNAKEALSVDTDVTIPIILPGVQTSVRLTRQEFEAMIEPRIGETIAALERAVQSSGLRMQDVSKVLLVGGSSRIPLVRQRVRQATGVPVVVDAHPKHAIALGAAEAAARLAGLTTTQPPAAVPPVVTPAQQSVAPVYAASAAAAAGGGQPPAGAQPGAAAGSSLPIPIWLIVAIVAGAFVLGVLAFVIVNQLGGDDDGGGGDVASTQTAEAQAAAPTATDSGAGVGTAIVADPTATTASAAAAGCEAAPSAEAIMITDIQMQAGDYAIFFDACGVSIEHPEGIDDPNLEQLPRKHAHFYWNTLPIEDAGVPGAGPWNQYGGPSPYVIAELDPGSAVSIASKPADATQICSAVSLEDHTILPDSGNCVDVPAAATGEELCEADPRPEAILIYDIQIENDDYAVFFQTCGDINIDHPEGISDPDTSGLPRPHAHFYWNTTGPTDAGPPGAGPWLIYGGPSPLLIANYAPGGSMSKVNQPADATEMCVVLVNADHTVRPDTGNCFALP